MDLTEDELQVVLTKSKDKQYRCIDFLNALRGVGIKKGDTICVHSQLTGFGIPAIDKNQYLDYLIKILQMTIGTEGTLLMPTFSYSFCKNENYNIMESPSTVGLLTEYFRKSKDVVRTNHPIFSFSIWGRRKEEFLNIGLDAFGLDSVYGKMLEHDDKMIMFGAPKGYTFYYLSEQALGVSHRYFKEFSGTVIDGVDKYNLTVPYYVRHLDMRSIEDENKVNDFLNDKGIQLSITLNRGTISVFNCKEMFYNCVNKLKEDEMFFLKE